MPYPICSVVAVFKMLVRILNTLRSRIWDMALFLFSDYSKSTVDENGNSPEFYTPFRSAQNHCPPDNVRPAGGYIRWEIDSPTDTDLLLATYRGGSHLTSDIYINTKCCILPQIFELILSDWNKQNIGNVNRYKL